MMSQSQYSLTWEAHVKNVCDGLSTLQQSGEFVDMTLAADGHVVKVHQVVLALASPYFKELITSAQCPHPVIFLTKVSHSTLAALLEYIYTGEVLVSLEHLNDLIEAAKELHIKGLKDMNVNSSNTDTSNQLSMEPSGEEILEDENLCLFQVTTEEDENFNGQTQNTVNRIDNVIEYTVNYDNEQFNQNNRNIQGEKLSQIAQCNVNIQRLNSTQDRDNRDMDVNVDQDTVSQNIVDDDMQDTESNISFESNKSKLDTTCSALQYTVSNQGSLQMILNRFVYYLKHTNRDKSRQWRCVDYLNHVAKCPAHVFTKDDIVIQRISAHTHPFHDKRILKKLKNGNVYSAVTEAEQERDSKKKKANELSMNE